MTAKLIREAAGHMSVTILVEGTTVNYAKFNDAYYVSQVLRVWTVYDNETVLHRLVVFEFELE